MKLPPHKCGLFLTHNEHRDYYEPVTKWIAEHEYDWPSDEAKARALATDEVWVLQWYPETPIGFNLVAAPTLEELLAFANGDESNNFDQPTPVENQKPI